MIAIQPDSLSLWTLVKYIRFLRDNGQNRSDITNMPCGSNSSTRWQPG